MGRVRTRTASRKRLKSVGGRMWLSTQVHSVRTVLPLSMLVFGVAQDVRVDKLAGTGADRRDIAVEGRLLITVICDADAAKRSECESTI
jgi:hypothetical protein